MKLSEMNNDQACEAMIRLSEPCSNLLQDEDIVSLLEKFQETNDEKLAQMVGRLLPQFVSFSLKKHKADLYEIVGVFAEVQTEEVGNMSFMKTIRILRESIDKDFIDFLQSSGSVTSKPGEK